MHLNFLTALPDELVFAILASLFELCAQCPRQFTDVCLRWRLVSTEAGSLMAKAYRGLLIGKYHLLAVNPLGVPCAPLVGWAALVKTMRPGPPPSLFLPARRNIDVCLHVLTMTRLDTDSELVARMKRFRIHANYMAANVDILDADMALRMAMDTSRCPNYGACPARSAAVNNWAVECDHRRMCRTCLAPECTLI